MKNWLIVLFYVLWMVPMVSAQKEEKLKVPNLSIEQANRLSKLPLNCMFTQYPNKLGQTLGGEEDLRSPKSLHPAFYGCFDWHSSVHGHWSLVSLLKQYPEIENAAQIKKDLLKNISKENIIKEVQYFKGKHNKIYERTYGWAWLLKLAEELNSWDDPLARQLESNLQPLTKLIVDKYIEFLPKLNYPIRVGEHPNTAFGMSFAWDYANTTGNITLKELIEKRSKFFYMDDVSCPMSWEPGGYDFLSPCLEEAALMLRVLPKNEYKKWLSLFLPQLSDKNYALVPGIVSDRTDGKLVHLDGVNFSRAWCLNTIANKYPTYKHLKKNAVEHIIYSLPNIVDGNYEGGHWLGSFAIYALNSVK